MQPFKGIAFKITAIALFSVMAALIKATADDVPAGQAVFFRSFFALFVIFVWLLQRGEMPQGLRVTNAMGHVWRGVIGTTSMGMNFAALGLLPLPEVTAIGFAAPLMTVIFASMFLSEEVRAFRLTAVGIGLVGVCVVLWPRLTIFDADQASAVATIGVMLVLGSALFRALAQIHIRKLVQTDQTSAIVFYFSLTASCLSLLTLPFGWVIPTWEQAALLVTAGLIGGVAQIMLTSCYRFAPASVVAPFDYVAMLFAIVIGYVWFSEIPTPQMLVGAAIVISAGILIIWRERQLGLERGKARPGITPQG
ncbi:DMT family transporter [Shimia sagamensis]|uniref:Permease of the drug/metabolite transporter (DMT) superfamily n=1 Tax=Shimia sagamensis TaxID=1566352 RepID=A0ABY1N9G9_9RHOB|nr:DMT family transporter [Shimia sagamensis]SMP04117.1 Permease of the drug/metabolite transporter (DMT) superfamily [Shimia sagamensis]